MWIAERNAIAKKLTTGSYYSEYIVIPNLLGITNKLPQAADEGMRIWYIQNYVFEV